MSDPLGAQLGRIAAPPLAQPFEDVRLALLDALVARRRGGALTPAAWVEEFDAATRSLRLRVLADAERAIREAAREARLPSRRLAAELPDAERADRLLQRLLAEGIPLEALADAPDDAAGERARAAALEAAWDGARRIALEERARWRERADALATWRRPLAPLWIGVALLAVPLVIAGAWLGGQLTPPEWFRPIHEWFWGLPWP